MKLIKQYFSNSSFLSIALISLISIVTITIDSLKKQGSLTLILFTAIIICSIFTSLGIKKLKQLKLNQVIRAEGPKKHLAKSGTPTMGGIIIVPIGIIIGNLFTFNGTFHHQVLGVSTLTLAYMFIGIIDDWRSYSLNTNSGLKPKGKVILQAGAGILFLLWANSQGLIHSNISILKNHSIYFGELIWVIALFLLIAESNATNLTDGLDGLASGCGAIVFTGLAIELILQDDINSYKLASFCIAMAGSWLGFLVKNKHPAQIFMGDTGSLSMGAALIGVALISNTLWSLCIMGIIFLIESVSVIMQVGIFKITKQLNGQGHRILLMAPLHHHFELNGVKEVEIVRNFWFINIIFVILSFLLRST